MFEVKRGRYAFNSDGGVRVETIGRYKVIYFVNERLLILPCDGETGQEKDGKWIERIYFFPTLRWEWPYHNRPISNEEREKIKNDIVAAYAVLEPSMRVEFKEKID